MNEDFEDDRYSFRQRRIIQLERDYPRESFREARASYRYMPTSYRHSPTKRLIRAAYLFVAPFAIVFLVMVAIAVATAILEPSAAATPLPKGGAVPVGSMICNNA